MSRESWPINDRDAWLARRERDVTSTDAASLCGVGRKTRYQLFCEKRLGLSVPVEENEAMRLGTRLEAPIAEHLALEHGMEIEPFKDYIRIPEFRIGSSFDYRAKDRSYLLEIKLVGPQAMRDWQVTDYGLEAPIHIEAQVQTEMLCAEIPVCFIGVLCGTQTYLLRREFDQAVADRLQNEARSFWESPQPEPDWQVDADFIIALRKQSAPGKVIQADARIEELMATYKAAGEWVRDYEKQRDAARAELLTLIDDAERVEGSAYYALAKAQPEVVVESFVRKASRPLRIYERKS